MTEEEAKTRSCCGPLHFDGVFEGCVGSNCMAWRWTTDSLYLAFEGIPPEPVFRKHDKESLRGYCGLAGKP